MLLFARLSGWYDNSAQNFPTHGTMYICTNSTALDIIIESGSQGIKQCQGCRGCGALFRLRRSHLHEEDVIPFIHFGIRGYVIILLGLL
jgi:hypothetical protein